MYKQIKETAAWLTLHSPLRPTTAIILGTGLGTLARDIEVKARLPYADIPHFPLSTVESHEGCLLIGTLGGIPLLAMQGRFHFYEGYSMKEVTFPIRVFHEFGINTLIVSNAAGGMNPDFQVGDIMFITDHINMMPEHPLRGKNFPGGPRFPDMSEAYDHELLAIARQVAREEGFEVKEGVYVATQGPTFETPAEYRMFRTLGADAVGMSTVPEVIVARHAGMRVFGASIITDLGIPGQVEKVSHEAVMAAAEDAQPRLSAIARGIIQRI